MAHLDRLTGTQRRLAIGLVLAVSLVAFESTAVLTALPTISDDLDGDGLYGATLAAYMLAEIVALAWSGRQADNHGIHRPFLISMAVFIVGLIVAAVAPNMITVVIGRALQGAGTGGFAPLSYVAVKRAFPENRQASLFALLSSGWVLPALLSPLIAGVITDRFHWRLVFIAIMPVAVVITALTERSLRSIGRANDADESGGSAPTDSGQSLAAAALAASGIALMIVGLQNDRWPVAVGAIVAGLALAGKPLARMLPAGIIRARGGLPAIVAARGLATAAFLGVDSFVPLAADRIHGVSAMAQGLVIAGASVTWTAGQVIVARWPQLFGRRSPITIGFALMAISVVLVVPVLHSSWPLPLVLLAWAVGGLGMGFVFNPTTTASLSYAADGNEGAISSQVQLADALGFGLMGAIGGATVNLADRGTLDLQQAIGSNFVLAALCAVVGLLIASRCRPAGSGAASAPR